MMRASPPGERFRTETPSQKIAGVQSGRRPQSEALIKYDVMTEHPIFTLPLLQAVSDWQRGGDHKQKIKRGNALKAACLSLPARYRAPPARCYRQESHEENRTWQLLIDNKLPETIAAWSLSLDVALTFKGGVPPPGQRGIIFQIAPEAHQVIANLAELYADPDFLLAAEARKSDIKGYHSGIGDYGNSQHEVVLELGSLDRATIHRYGGFAGTLDELIAEFEVQHGRQPDTKELAQIQTFIGKPWWLTPKGTFAVVSRTLGHVSARRWLGPDPAQ